MSNINLVLNEILVKMFRSVNTIEEHAIKSRGDQNMTANDMHVIEAIGIAGQKNMSSVAKSLMVTMGTLTIAVNSLVKKGYVQRTRSSQDRRVVLISLTEKGQVAFMEQKQFHDNMIEHAIELLTEEEKKVLQKSLLRLHNYFRKQQEDISS